MTLAFEDISSKVLDAVSLADVDADQSAWYQGPTTNYLDRLSNTENERIHA